MNNERNAKFAARCDQKISKVRTRTKLQWNSVIAVQAHIPKINSGIKDIMDKLGNNCNIIVLYREYSEDIHFQILQISS